MIRSILMLCPLLLAFPISADNLKGFWDKGGVNKINQPMRENSSEGIAFGDGPIQAKEQTWVMSDQPIEEAAPAEESKPSEPQSREEIVKAYGNPKEDRKLKLEDNAPLELKGLAAALNSGDKELAFEYARAHVRYQQQVNRFVDRSVEYQMAALEAERIKKKDPSNVESSSPYRREIEESIGIAAKEALPRLTKEAKEMLASALVAHEREIGREESEDRKSPYPISTDGRVQVLFFFSFDSTDSLLHLKNVKELATKLAPDTRVEFLGLSVPARKPKELEALRKQYGLNFSVIDGQALAEKMKIAIIPTLLFAVPLTGESYIPDTVPGTEEALKIVSEMQGTR